VKNPALKYRNAIGWLTFCGYLLIFLINVFHYHTYVLSDVPAIEVESESNFQTIISNTEFACIVHQNFSSLHNLTILKPYGFDFIHKEQLVKHSGSSQSHISNLFHLSNQLRAPPIFS
jgi:hypothetical protein